MNTQETAEKKDLSWLQVVQNHVESLRFGTVQITVHDGHVVQIERTEKVRIDKSLKKSNQP